MLYDLPLVIPMIQTSPKLLTKKTLAKTVHETTRIWDKVSGTQQSREVEKSNH